MSGYAAKLRCVRLKQRASGKKPIADLLIELGVAELSAWLMATSTKGWWRKAKTPSPSSDEPGLV